MRLVERRDRAVELLFVHRLQNLADARARVRGRARGDGGRGGSAPAGGAPRRARARARGTSPSAVQSNRPGSRPRQSDFATPGEQFEIDFVREPPERAVADLVPHLEPRARLQVLRHEPGTCRRTS